MPMTATMAPYTLFILDDDTPLNPREDHDCLGKMVCWHSRYSLGEKHDYDEPSDFLRNLLFSEYSSGHDRNNPVFAFDLDEFYEDEAADSAEYEVEADYGEEL